MLTRTRRRVTAFVVAALMGAGIVAGPATPNAHADNGNMVIFGDSVVADAPSLEYLSARVGTHPNGKSDPARWCPTSGNNFGKQAARRLGLQPRDYSCPGAVSISPGPNISAQIDRAVRERGGLDRGTKRVVLQVGFNDTYNHRGEDPKKIRRDYVNFMRPQVDKIRRAAPNARIQIVGYPTITGGDRVCLFHVGPNMYDATPIPEVRYWEDLAQWMNVDLAKATGTQFVDFKPGTRNNGMCARDEDREFAGLIDFYAGPGNMPIHVTQRGHEHLGRILAAS
ncbi:GDSL-type esterase/lipase family protein [Corynebacterium sp. p3-SID1145]|nr:GDSL-type esterase/lipase family protein [Corynebacterium sp. p3-SID1145]MCT1460722.1 GDSL-type esterase/lipase family protein [Corynebacterium sp. p3-SID1140]